MILKPKIELEFVFVTFQCKIVSYTLIKIFTIWICSFLNVQNMLGEKVST